MTKFCHECGAETGGTARFCNKCGTPLLPAQSAPTSNSSTRQFQTPPNPQPFGNPPPYQPPPQMPSPQPFQTLVTETEMKPNIAGTLCYPLSFVTGLLFLVLTPYNKDRFVRFHAWQSVFFFIGLFALNLAQGVLSWFLPRFMSNLLSSGMNVIALGGTIWMMIEAYHGKVTKLPVIGDLAEKQATDVR